MVITENQVAQVANELKSLRGGVDNDYFGLCQVGVTDLFRTFWE
jgi:hypothetical protein